jgi:altronate dehydratase small subunit
MPKVNAAYSEEFAITRATKKDRRNSLRSLLLLFQTPTGLADGFGLKELPYPPKWKEFTPRWWVPRSRLPAGLGRYSLVRCSRAIPVCTLTIAVRAGRVKDQFWGAAAADDGHTGRSGRRDSMHVCACARPVRWGDSPEAGGVSWPLHMTSAMAHPGTAAAGAGTTERRLVQRMQPTDTVATALVELTPGTLVRVADSTGTTPPVEVVVRGTIPFGHKVALRQVAVGEPVLKYGEAIGLASAPIEAGEHVHTHNVDSQRGRGDLKK